MRNVRAFARYLSWWEVVEALVSVGVALSLLPLTVPLIQKWGAGWACSGHSHQGGCSIEEYGPSAAGANFIAVFVTGLIVFGLLRFARYVWRKLRMNKPE